MKKLSEYITEQIGDPIDDQWINDEKPVKTKDGNQVIITKIDMSQVPNIILGKVKFGEDLFDYEWDENGICQKALDQKGNPKQPTENDNLVKAS
jgi:hypothetical protein